MIGCLSGMFDIQKCRREVAKRNARMNDSSQETLLCASGLYEDVCLVSSSGSELVNSRERANERRFGIMAARTPDLELLVFAQIIRL